MRHEFPRDSRGKGVCVNCGAPEAHISPDICPGPEAKAAAMKAMFTAPASNSAVDDDIDWFAEWQATSSLRIAEAHVRERLIEALEKASTWHRMQRKGLSRRQQGRINDHDAQIDAIHIAITSVETGNG